MRSIQALSWLVVHRRADYHDVGGEELFQHFFTHRDFMLQRGIAQLRRGAAGGQGQGGEMRHRVGGQVAVGDVKPVFVLPPGLDQLGAQLAGSGGVAEDAGIDMQKFHVSLLKVGDRSVAIEWFASYRQGQSTISR